MCSLDNYLTLSQLARRCPGRPHVTTLWRWARRGVKARNGQRVRLRHVRVGETIYAHRDWLNDFFAALAEHDCRHFEHSRPRCNAHPTSTQKRETADSNKCHVRAEKALIEEGI